VLGGCEEFEESRPTCRRNASNSTRNASINTACSSTKAANSSYEGGTGGSDTGGVKHDQTAATSTDTPQVSRGSDWLRRELLTSSDPSCFAPSLIMFRRRPRRRGRLHVLVYEALVFRSFGAVAGPWGHAGDAWFVDLGG
jgi:hypothetical protein